MTNQQNKRFMKYRQNIEINRNTCFIVKLFEQTMNLTDLP